MRLIAAFFCTFFGALTFVVTVNAQQNIQSKYQSKVWHPDNGNGTFTNPIIHADYSDPDVIRVGEDFYLTASSFNAAPGLPILHSKDLVNWELLTYAIQSPTPYSRFASMQPGGGVWAPAIRYHNGSFYIYYPDPDEGIFMVKAQNILGPWSEPLLVKKAKGWIDPCAFWDEDGNAYLVNGLAGSRAGIKSCLILNKMSADGTKLLDNGVMIFDGHDKNPTVEGPKMYKRNGYYYILAPAGGVGTGWQLALRSKNIYGPYEQKVVLESGKSATNGPHQGGWVETITGESWFIHFQDKDAYGRILHLEPVKWVDNWPLMGKDLDGNGIGEPVDTYRKPNVGKSFPVMNPVENDEFNNSTLGLAWQWNAIPQANFCFPAGKAYGFLRLFNIPLPDSVKNLFHAPNVLSQKLPANNFSATTKLTFTARTNDEETGLIVTGLDYSYISIKKTNEGYVVGQSICKNAIEGTPETKSSTIKVNSNTIYLKVQVNNIVPNTIEYSKYNNALNSTFGNALCTFSYSEDGQHFQTIGEPFAAVKGKWIGAKVGLFAIRQGRTYETGYADYDWFRIDK